MAPVSPETIDACLPQTQCTRCGYPRCRDYAQAIADGSAEINRCPPGGEYTLNALGQLLGRPGLALDPDCGAPSARLRAVIDEDICIGCRKCIDACPVDAIVGARKLMHTVLASECTGCELCLPPCPVDCINLVRPPEGSGDRWPEYAEREVDRWRHRTELHFRRLTQMNRIQSGRRRHSVFPGRETIRNEIQAALRRVRSRRG